MSTDDGDKRPAEALATRPRFLSLTLEMVRDVDFENVIHGAVSADIRNYENLFAKAEEVAEEKGNENHAVVYAVLRALCGFQF
ncbi:DUF7380 domain-containing protein, partial [Flavobacterium poyangense]|uniref:DUF7380 domain-containing protein n=1 Tax=Flavobacterium poyangense TaxID=2204302 RepID=UPI001422F2A1